MATKGNTSHKTCPYWSAATMKCRICSGGLFIPLNDHIETYCKSASFEPCLQYSMHVDYNTVILENRSDSFKNRRKYVRILDQRRVTLVQLVNSKKIVSHHTITAQTIDLSIGGMRLHTDKPLTSDTTMHFSLQPSVDEKPCNGIGQVAWCNKQIDEPGYQVGISFHDEHLIQAVGSFLGNQGEQL